MKVHELLTEVFNLFALVDERGYVVKDRLTKEQILHVAANKKHYFKKHGNLKVKLSPKIADLDVVKKTSHCRLR